MKTLRNYFGKYLRYREHRRKIGGRDSETDGNYIYLNYPTTSVNEPRWGYEKPPHDFLYEIINRNRTGYRELLTSFNEYAGKYLDIKGREDEVAETEPYLGNPWLPCLDSLALYCMLASHKPEIYLEVGSGNSTKFARRSIDDNNLSTRIVSIDPQPRAEIDAICDSITRKPLEQVDYEIFEKLGPNDVLFVDNSHRSFMNSDVTVLFLDILPRLKPGVLVEIHDIFLPSDYPPAWKERYYNEQYILAAFLLAETKMFTNVLPNAFIHGDDELREILAPILGRPGFSGLNCGGGSFWIRMN